MKTTVRYLGGVQFEAETRGHRLQTDLEVTSGGSDQAMSPPELLLASLGTCAGFYAMQYLKAHKLSAQSLEVEVVADKVKDPARLGAFRIEVRGAAEANPEGLKRAIEKCLIHSTLLHPPKIEIVIEQPAFTAPGSPSTQL
jgi:putative redox protein